MFVFGDDWTDVADDEYNLYFRKSVLVDAHYGAQTNYTWTKFDGTPLNYTNWGRKHPKINTNVVLHLQTTRKYNENCKS